MLAVNKNAKKRVLADQARVKPDTPNLVPVQAGMQKALGETPVNKTKNAATQKLRPKAPDQDMLTKTDCR